jgi:hypothetical protein
MLSVREAKTFPEIVKSGALYGTKEFKIMAKRFSLVAGSLSALALAACSHSPEPMAQTTTPIYAKDGTIIGQTVVVPTDDRNSAGADGVSMDDNMDIDPDAIDDDDDG